MPKRDRGEDAAVAVAEEAEAEVEETPEEAEARAAAKAERKRLRKERKRAEREKAQANGEASPSPSPSVSPEPSSTAKETTTKETTTKETTEATMVAATLAEAREWFPSRARAAFDAATHGFEKPTPIQANVWRAALAGKDVVGIASTGSGKTLAFALPAIARLLLETKTETTAPKQQKGGVRPRALVLSPTRELCLQILDVAKTAATAVQLKTGVAYGGASRGDQLRDLSRGGADLMVATPGRLIDFLDAGDVSVEACAVLVLDEADRMLDMGFERDVRRILRDTPRDARQTLMFSATWPPEIRAIAAEFLTPDAVRVMLAGEKLKAASTIKQFVEVLRPDQKERRLLEVLRERRPRGNEKTIVFALYKKEAERLEGFLARNRYNVVGVHGDKSQAKREEAVSLFTKGKADILVATDVAARGLDIEGVDLVVNVTYPLTTEDLVHRVGRTGRAGRSGVAVTFFTEQDKNHAGAFQNVLREAGVEIPPELAKFGNAVKKRTHEIWGAHYRGSADDAPMKAPTKVEFASDDEE